MKSAWFVALFIMGSWPDTAASADWPMRGGSSTRNPVSLERNPPLEWNLGRSEAPAANLRWSAKLGHISCGDPVISDGLVWVGTNGGHGEGSEDCSVLACFRERDGQRLYSHRTPRLKPTRANEFPDWPESSLASSPLIEGDRLWFVTNRCEVICLDIAPLKKEAGEPRVVWSLDLCQKFGVTPRACMIACHATHCSIASHGDLLYVNTTHAHGFDPKVPPVEAPSLLCLQKVDGAVRWQDTVSDPTIRHSYGSPLVATIGGRPQVIAGRGDGWARGFDAQTGAPLWRLDMNLKGPPRQWTSRLARGEQISIPVLHEGRVYIAVGNETEALSGPGRVVCMDPTRRGDISSQVLATDGTVCANPDSGVIWEFTGEADGQDESSLMHKSLGSVAVHEGLALAVGTEGDIHCLDARTGRHEWSYDAGSQIWGSPLIVDGHVYLAVEQAALLTFPLSRQFPTISTHEFPYDLHSGPAFANGTLYVLSLDELFAIGGAR